MHEGKVARSPGRETGLIVLMTLLVLANNLFLATVSPEPPMGDSSHILGIALEIAAAIQRADLGRVLDLWTGSIEPHPLLGPLSCAVAYLATGRNPLAPLFTTTLFLFLLLWLLWLLTRRLEGTHGAALPAFVLAATPAILHASGIFMLDLPLAAFTVGAALALVACEDFSRRRESLLFGLCCGAAMLTKNTFLPYIAAPFLFFFIRFLWRASRPRLLFPLVLLLTGCTCLAAWKSLPALVAAEKSMAAGSIAPLFLLLTAIFAALAALFFHLARRRESPSFLNFLLAAFAFLAVAGPLYLLHLPELSNLFLSSAGVGYQPRGFMTAGSVHGATFYLWALKDMWGDFSMLLFLVGVPLALLPGKHRQGRLVALGFILGGALLLTFLIKVKQVRYFLPLLPFACIVASTWILALPGRARAVVTALIVVMGLTQVAAFDLARLWPEEKILALQAPLRRVFPPLQLPGREVQVPERNSPVPPPMYPFPAPYYGPAHAPGVKSWDEWRVKEILEDIRILSGGKARDVILSIRDDRYFRYGIFYYYSRLLGEPLELHPLDFQHSVTVPFQYAFIACNPGNNLTNDLQRRLTSRPTKVYRLPMDYTGWLYILNSPSPEDTELVKSAAPSTR